MFKGMKTTLVIIAMSVLCLVSCENTGGSTEESADVSDTTAVNLIDSVTTENVTITDVSVTADSAQ